MLTLFFLGLIRFTFGGRAHFQRVMHFFFSLFQDLNSNHGHGNGRYPSERKRREPDDWRAFGFSIEEN